MAGTLALKGTEISSAPCSVQKAARLLRCFLSSEAALEVGIARGYVEAVSQSLEEMLARLKDNARKGTEGLRLTTGERSSSKYFNIEEVQKSPEAKKKRRKEEETKESKQKVKKKRRKEKESMESKQSKQKKTDADAALIDFEALLGHELDDQA